MIEEIDEEGLFTLVVEGITSGSYAQADVSVSLMADFGTTEIFVRLIGKTYVDSEGVIWVTPEFVVSGKDQQVVDYFFWQLLALAPDDALEQCGIWREEIKIVCFRTYGNDPDPACTYMEHYSNMWQESAVYQMQKLPDLLWKFPNLRQINAQQAVLSDIPDSIGKCVNLLRLVLRHGTFRTLPVSIGELRNLRSLIITHSELQVLPESISRLSGLVHVDLSHNGFSVLPLTVSALTQLRHLDVSENRSLRELPPELCNLDLEYLNLRGCLKLEPAALRETFSRIGEVHRAKQILLEHAPQPVDDVPLLPPVPGIHIRVVPRRPPSDLPGNQAEAEIIRKLLLSDDPAHFLAGLRLLQTKNNALLTEHLLCEVDVFRMAGPLLAHNGAAATRRTGRRSASDASQWMPCYRAVLSFLTDPAASVCRDPDAWMATQHSLTLIPECSEDLSAISFFPGLRELTLCFLYEGIHVDLSGTLLPETVKVVRIAADRLSFRGADNGCRFIRFDGIIRLKKLVVAGLTRLSGITGCTKLTAESVVIRNCPGLRHINDFTMENPVDLYVTNCPVLFRADFTAAGYRRIHIVGCSAIDYLALSGVWPAENQITIDGPAVRVLKLNSCGFTQIPDVLHQLTNIELLSLSHNLLTSLPGSLAVLTRLKQIALTGNQFETVPPVLAAFSRLMKIRFGWQTHSAVGQNSLHDGFSVLSELSRLEIVELFMPDEQLRKLAWHLRKPRARFVDSMQTVNPEYFIS